MTDESIALDASDAGDGYPNPYAAKSLLDYVKQATDGYRSLLSDDGQPDSVSNDEQQTNPTALSGAPEVVEADDSASSQYDDLAGDDKNFQKASWNTSNKAEDNQAPKSASPSLDLRGTIDPNGPVATHLPGLGQTYLDPRMASKVDAFIKNAKDNGVSLDFSSAYRSPEQQATLRNSGKGTVVTPAQNSLHSAGLAVDVNYGHLSSSQQATIRNAAAAAGLSWGGNFHTNPDPVHFYFDPGGNRGTTISNFSTQIRALQQRH